MASLYRRSDSPFWWIKWRVPGMKRPKLKSTGETDRAKAEEVLEEVRQQLASMKRTGATRIPTVGEFAAGWLGRRKANGIVSARDERGRLKHLSPAFRDMPMDAVTREDVLNEVSRLRREATSRHKHQKGRRLSDRSVRKIYEALRVMFDDAQYEPHKYVRANPCTLKESRREIPANEDSDPFFRDEAQLVADDVAALIHDPRLSMYRRVLYGLQFLGAMRISELADRRFRDIRPAEPFSKLVISSSWDRKELVVRPTKTGAHRRMPLLPVLQALLDAWRAHGWASVFGRAPTPEDLLVPSLRGPEHHLNSNTTLKYLGKDLAMLGTKRVRQHDGRRTLISLARSMGANEAMLKWATHGRKKGIMNDYTTPEWWAICRAVAAVEGYAGLRGPNGPVIPGASEWARRDSNPNHAPSRGPLGNTKAPWESPFGVGGWTNPGPSESGERSPVATPSPEWAALDRFYLTAMDAEAAGALQ